MGKKTEMIKVPMPHGQLPRPSRGNTYPSALNLSKSELGGAIFGCNDKTMRECLGKQLFGLPSSHFSYVKNIEPGMTLFLFNYNHRRMHGIYEAASAGEMNIDPYAWTDDGREKSGFPAQVRMRIRMQCQPITENQFKKVLCNNYYKTQHFWFELSHAQTEGLLALFLASNPSPNRMMLPASSSETNLYTVSPATKCNLVPRFECVNSGAVEPKNANEMLPLNKEKYKKYAGPDANMTIDEEAEFREPSHNCGDSVEETVGTSLLDASRHQGRVRLTMSEPQFFTQKLDSKEEKYHMIEQPSIPRMLSDSVDERNLTTSDLLNVKAELVQIVKELKERADTLEKKQFESMLEIQELTNVVKDSGAEIQRLSSRIVELETKSLQRSGNTIFLIGGFNGKSWLSALDAFSPSVDMLVPRKAMNSARSYASAAALNNDSLYVFGGGDGSSWFDTVECYSLENDSWSFCPPLVRPKGSLAAVTLKNKIFALGGGNGSECFSDVEMFDPALGRWIRNQPLLQKRYAPAAAVLHDIIYATGGFDGKSYLQTAERCDPREGHWTRLPDMKASRGSHSMAVINEKLYAIGGFNGSTMASTVEIYDPRNDSWMEGSSMNIARGYASVAQLGGSLFIIGGVGANHDIVETVECYSDGSGWKNCTYNAIGKRCFCSAVVMSVSGSLNSLGNHSDGA